MVMAGNRLPYPDTAFVNGKVRTFASGPQTAQTVQAVACSRGRIAAVGTSDEVLRLCGADTREVNLGGRPAVPGLTDAHVHLADKGLAERELVDCRDFYGPVASIADVLARLSRQAADTPAGRWVVGQGSPMQDFRMRDKRFPDRNDLDAAVPDHPVSLSFGAHVTVANTRALALAGITGETPDPAGGSIERDPGTGEPTGILHERAQHMVAGVTPDFDAAQRKMGIAYAVQQSLERGVTTIHDIVKDPDAVRAYQELAREGGLHMRVSLLLRIIESAMSTDSVLETGLQTGFGNEWLRVGGVKMSIDGGITGRNALFYEPYRDVPDYRGLIRIQQDELDETVARCHQAGLRCCVHAIGDRAFDMALAAYEKALRAAPRDDHRHRIEHMGNWLMSPERIEKLVRMGIVAIPNISLGYFVGDSIREAVGAHRLAGAFPFKTLLAAGVKMAGGSDAPGYWPVDPLRDIGAYVSRQTLWGETLVPEEALSVRQAFELHTTHAAFAGFEEDCKGTLEVGKLADMAVLAEDPFETPAERIKDLKVEMTVVGGEVRHRA